MADDDLCKHDLAPGTCSTCKHGVTPRSTEQLPPETECGSCGAAIRWVETTNGKRMPIDADPSSDGRFVLDGRSLLGMTIARHLRRDETTVRDTYASHFATCPDADAHRRR